MNPNFTLLASNKIGAITFCKKAQQFNIGIGTTLLKFTPTDAKSFLTNLQDLKKQLKTKQNCCNKAFISTPISNLFIALNECELLQSIDLIEYALLRHEVECLLITED